MSTKATVSFASHDGEVMASVFVHNAGHMTAGTFTEFFDAVKDSCSGAVRDYRFFDPSYLAAKYVTWSLAGSLAFGDVGVIARPEEWHAHRRFTVRCHAEPSAAHPEVTEDDQAPVAEASARPVTPGQVLRATLIACRAARGVPADQRPWDALPDEDREDLEVAAQAVAVMALPHTMAGAAIHLARAAGLRAARDEAVADLAAVREEAEFLRADRDRHELAASQERAAREELESESGAQWVVFHGGPDPDSCAGYEVVAGHAEAEEEARWRIESGVARRGVAYGPWEVMSSGDDEGGLAETAAMPA